jgi:hypothetical protein
MGTLGYFEALFGGSAAPRKPNQPVWVGRPRSSSKGGTPVPVTQRPAHFTGLSRKRFRLITKQQRRDAIDAKQRANRDQLTWAMRGER